MRRIHKMTPRGIVRELTMDTTKDNKTTDLGLQIDWGNPEDARKAFIASEVFNRKY